jgi:hypothetical protein
MVLLVLQRIAAIKLGLNYENNLPNIAQLHVLPTTIKKMTKKCFI